MKKALLILFSSIIALVGYSGKPPLSGDILIGPGKTYSTLASAFNYAHANGISGNVFFILQDNYTGESYPITITSIKYASSSATITVYPKSTGRIISGSSTSEIIDFNGVSWVNFDGRPGKSGVMDLVIENTNTSGTTVQFENNASNIDIQYCNIKGSINPISDGGVIYFSSGNNNYNTIDHCNIGNSSSDAGTMIYCNTNSWLGGSGQALNNTISNCNIFNFSNYGIYLYSGCSGWTISGNSFYHMAAMNPTSDLNCQIIYVYSGGNYTISNNYFGGSAPQCGSVPWTVGCNNNVGNILYCLWIANGSSNGTNSVQGNTFSNFDFSSGAYDNDNIIRWAGIIADVGNLSCSGNIIGSATNPDDLKFTMVPGGNQNTYVVGIHCEVPGTLDNNNFGRITLTGGVASKKMALRLINVVPDNSTTVSNNILGVDGESQSIKTSNLTANSIATITGINTKSSGYTSGDVSIQTNQILNFYNDINNNSSSVTGIYIDASSILSSLSITENIIHDLTCSAPSTTLPSVSGIYSESTSSYQTFSGNTIYNLSNPNSSASGIYIAGICIPGKGGSITCSKNFLHHFTLPNNTSGSSAVYGIQIPSSAALTGTYANNMISLGTDQGQKPQIYGIMNAGSGSASFYYNSIYIGGVTSGSSMGNTYGMYRSSTSTNIIENNVFQNSRSGGSGGYHYAIGLTSVSNLTSNYNDLYSGGTGNGVLGTYNGNQSTLASWKSATGKDASSVSGDPLFLVPSGDASSVNLHIEDILSPCASAALYISSVTDDFDGETRPTSGPDIGADQFSNPLIWTGTVSTEWNNPSNWNTMKTPSPSNNIIIPAGCPHYPVINTFNTITCKSVNINATASITINPKCSLKVNNSLSLNGSQCIVVKSDATGTGSLMYGSLSGLGTACVQQYLTQNCWHYISSPVSNGFTGVFLRDWLRYYLEPLGAWSGYIVPVSTPLPVMQGYEVWSSSSTGNPLKSFTGLLNSGTVTTLPLTYTPLGGKGWNLIGNPFPCPVDLQSSAITWNNVTPTVYYWDPVAQNYLSYTANPGYGTGSRYIPAMQGFYVQVNNFAGGTVSMTNSAMALDPGRQIIYKSTEGNHELMILRAISDQDASYDKSLICFDQKSKPGFEDDLDAYKWSGATNAPQLYTMADNVEVCINTMPFRGVNMVIPVYFSCGTSGNFTLTLEKSDYYPAGKTLYLKDYLRDTVVEFSPAKPYPFYYLRNSNPARFAILFKKPKVNGIGDIKSNLIATSGTFDIYSFEKTVYVNGGDSFINGDVDVYDLLGKMVFNGKLTSSSVNQFETHLPSGLYIVKVVTSDGQVQSQKVMIR